MLTIVAVVSFGAALFLARTSHPGQAAGGATGTGSSSSSDGAASQSFDYGQGSIAPSSGSAPQVQSSVS